MKYEQELEEALSGKIAQIERAKSEKPELWSQMVRLYSIKMEQRLIPTGQLPTERDIIRLRRELTKFGLYDDFGRVMGVFNSNLEQGPRTDRDRYGGFDGHNGGRKARVRPY